MKIPNDPRSVNESRNQGVPLLASAARSKVHQEIRALTLALAGRQDAGGAKPKKKGWFGG